MGRTGSAIDRAREATLGAPGSEQQQRAVEAGLGYALIRPGPAPWLGARLGVTENIEAGLGFSSDHARLDGRHAWQSERIALSAGLGLSGTLSGTTRSPELPNIEARDLFGWGADIPLIAGWRSDGDVIRVWGGPRAGFESLRGTLLLKLDPNNDLEQSTTLEGFRWYAGGIVGFAAGVAPLWVAVELQVDYQVLSSRTRAPEQAEPDVALDGLSMTPAVAMLVRF